MTDPAAITDAMSIARPAHLVASEVDGEMVVLDVESGNFFHLNGVGSKVWEALDQPVTFGDLCRTMQDKYDVDPATCRADVAGFVASMAQNGLISVG